MQFGESEACQHASISLNCYPRYAKNYHLDKMQFWKLLGINEGVFSHKEEPKKTKTRKFLLEPVFRRSRKGFWTKGPFLEAPGNYRAR